MTDALLQLIVTAVAVLIVVLLAVTIIALTLLARRAGATPRVLRRIDAFDSLPTTVGQAVETGRRLHISLGTGLVGTGDTTATGSRPHRARTRFRPPPP